MFPVPEPVANRTVSKVDMDLSWLLGLLTLVAAVMYVVVLFTVPAIRQPLTLVVFTALLALHLFLHWQVVKIAQRVSWLIAYVILQGILFFAIALLSSSPNMIFPLFAGLLGEAIGTLGLKRRGILATAYYVLLLIIAFLLRFDLGVSGWLIVGTAAIVISTVLYTVLYKRQVEARAQAQSLLQDLEAANRQLSEYAARVEELTTTAERQRMARELHDTLSQGLAGLILQLEAVEAHLTGSRPERALRIVQEAKSGARETLTESRQAIADLRQAGPRDLGEAARQETEHFTSSTGIPCAVEIALPATLLEPVTETAIRVIAEGLTNIARHARARSASLRIAVSEEAQELEIELHDDGIGFDPVSVEAGHYGLLGMRERVRLEGGRFEVQSAAGKGTRLVIRFPLEEVL
jgi:NarL family two-component system sensor histidine kinase YdfH